MADANALSYRQLQDAVLEKRFPASSRSWAQQWLAVAYQDVWGAADWPFKQVSRETFYTTSDGTSSGTPTASPLMPAAFAAITSGLLDNYDSPVRLISPEEFERQYTDMYAPAYGTPSVYTVVNRQILLYPTPDAAYQLHVSYRRRLAHKNVNGTVVAGFMSADDDYPLWDDHHRILVPRAQVIGLQERNDPTWPPLQDMFDQQLQAMQDDYLQDYPMVWGAATGGAW